MRLVVADTSPVFYLLSIGQIGLYFRSRMVSFWNFTQHAPSSSRSLIEHIGQIDLP